MALVEGRNGLPTARLAADGFTAEVYLHGAHLTSWKTPRGTELLFLSDKAVFQPPAAIRGGAPVCWPQFNDMGPLPQPHGFARNSQFEVAEHSADSVTMVLRDTAATAAQFPHPFELRLKTSLLPGGALRQEMRVRNTGAAPLEFTCALHTYFRCTAAAAAVRGLQGVSYLDSLQKRVRVVEGSEEVKFEGEVDRIYLDAPNELAIVDGVGAAGQQRAVQITKQGFQDVVLWNPAREKAKRMADFGDEEWREMVCVEVAQAGSGAARVAPGEQWTGTQELSCSDGM